MSNVENDIILYCKLYAALANPHLKILKLTVILTWGTRAIYFVIAHLRDLAIRKLKTSKKNFWRENDVAMQGILIFNVIQLPRLKLRGIEPANFSTLTTSFRIGVHLLHKRSTCHRRPLKFIVPYIPAINAPWCITRTHIFRLCIFKKFFKKFLRNILKKF